MMLKYALPVWVALFLAFSGILSAPAAWCTTYQVDLSGGSSIKSMDSLLFGAHTLLGDGFPNAMYPMRDIIKNDPPGMRVRGTAYPKSLGINALRFYEAYWVNYRSAIEGATVRRTLGATNEQIPASDSGYFFPYYNEILDYCAENNLACAIVLDTIYYNPITKAVYKTVQVADNPGLRAAAAQRNAVTIAQYYHNKHYTNRLILEIGNESIGYGQDMPPPTAAQYAAIVRDFARAIKNVAPEVEVAIYEWPDTSLYGLISANGDAAYIDHAVTHPYVPGPPWTDHQGFTDWENVTASALDSAGMGHVKILHTEYGVDMWSSNARTWNSDLVMNQGEISMSVHPRVSGFFEHSLFATAKAMYSNGVNWSVLPSYDDYQSGVHPPDTNPGAGTRFVTLASGLMGQALTQCYVGELSKYVGVPEASCDGFFTVNGDTGWVYLLNPGSVPFTIRLTGQRFCDYVNRIVASSTGERFSYDGTVPWSITRQCLSTGDNGYLDVYVPSGSIVVTSFHTKPSAPKLFVSDWNGNRVLAFDYTTGAYLGASGHYLPRGLAVGPDGYVYVAEPTPGNGTVSKVNPNTLGKSVFMNTGSYMPWDLAFRPDGNLLMSHTEGTTDNVELYQGPLGANPGTFITWWNKWLGYTTGIGVDMAGADAGDVYSAIVPGGWSGPWHTTGPNNTWASEPYYKPGATWAYDVAVGPDNNVYVTDNGAEKIRTTSHDLTADWTDFAVIPSGGPRGMIFDPNGDIVVASADTIFKVIGPGKPGAGTVTSFIVCDGQNGLPLSNSLQYLAFAGSASGVTGSIAYAKSAAENTLVTINGATVSARFFEYDQGTSSYVQKGFAIQADDRSQGIFVNSRSPVAPGDSVIVKGKTVTRDGERMVDAVLADVIWRGGSVPLPLGMSNRASGGGTNGAQEAVADDATAGPVKMSSGRSTIGLLTTLWGKVTTSVQTGTYDGYFYIDDGYGIKDGFGTGIACSPSSNSNGEPVPLPTVGRHVKVTGVMGVKQIGSLNVRHFRSVSWRYLD